MAIGAILQAQAAAVRFGNLTAQDQADPGAFRLGRKKGNEKIAGAGESRAFIPDGNFEARSRFDPSHFDPALRFERRIDRVAQKIDQKLFQLVAVSLKRYRRSARDGDS